MNAMMNPIIPIFNMLNKANNRDKITKPDIDAINALPKVAVEGVIILAPIQIGIEETIQATKNSNTGPNKPN
jgi:hypothetical protein